MDIVAPVFFAAKLYPRRPALMWIGGGVTYAMLAENIRSAARRIGDAGISRRDCVAVDIAGAYHHAVVTLALIHLGIASASMEEGAREALEAGGVGVIIADRDVEAGKCRVVRMDGSWIEPRPGAAPAPAGGFASPHDIYRITATSGTTGRPQPVVRSVGESLRSIEENRFFDVEGRTMSMLGFAAGVGLRVMLRALRGGGTFCMAGSPQDVYDTIQLCNVERLIASTKQLHELTQRAKEAAEPLHTLKSLVVGGAHVSERLAAEAQRFVCNNLLVHYASTQAGFVAMAPASMLAGRPGAVGFVVPHVEVQSVDDAGQSLPPGETGELRIRTTRTPRQTGADAAPEAGDFGDWIYPGDVGSLEADGMLIVAGRKSELINAGGVKVAPDLVDEILLGLEGVRDAAAFGMLDEHGQEQVWAAVASDIPLDIPALLAACRAALGARAPSVILRANAIPRNARGKIMRQQLRDEVRTLAGGSGGP